MEELQRLRTSRRGYRAHTTKLLTGIAELTSEAADASTEELTLTMEQLERKQTILEDLDTRIALLPMKRISKQRLSKQDKDSHRSCSPET